MRSRPVARRRAATRITRASRPFARELVDDPESVRVESEERDGALVLRASRNAAQKSVDEIRFASESAGAKLKAGMETSWEAMRKALDSASAAFKK